MKKVVYLYMCIFGFGITGTHLKDYPDDCFAGETKYTSKKFIDKIAKRLRGFYKLPFSIGKDMELTNIDA